MKKNKKIVLISIVVTAIALAFIGGQTYAKYMSRIEGHGTADIANWSFKVNEKDDSMQTIYLSSGENNKLSPGTKGNFQIKLDGTSSDVGINYNIKFENETKKPTNLNFIYNGKIYNSIKELEKELVGTINFNDDDKIKILNIDWEWKYETGNTEQEILKNDLIDTKDAKEIRNYNFDIIISGTQVEPEN